MALQDLHRLLATAQADPALRGRLNAPGADPLAIAAEQGLALTADDLQALRAMDDEQLEALFGAVQEMSDADLAGVSGGGGPNAVTTRQALEASCGSCWAFGAF